MAKDKYFKVVFNTDGEFDHVEGPEPENKIVKKGKGKALAEVSAESVPKFLLRSTEIIELVHMPWVSESVCCIVYEGQLYCWCS